MSKRARIIIITAVILVVAGIFAWPYLKPTGTKYTKFQVTPNASAALDSSIAKERPVFLEFYASW